MSTTVYAGHIPDHQMQGSHGQLLDPWWSVSELSVSVNNMAGLLKTLHLSGQRGSLCDGAHLELQGLPGQHPTALSGSVEDNSFSVLTWK